VRYYLVAAHYRSLVEYTEEALAEAAAGYRRVESFVHRVAERLGRPRPGPLCAEFTAAMDDDLGTPAALAAVHETVRVGNIALDAGDRQGALGAAGSVRCMLDVLGLDPLSDKWSAASSTVDRGAQRALTALVEELLADRQRARERRDYAAADAIRARLLAAGITVEDTPDGPLWTVKDDGIPSGSWPSPAGAGQQTKDPLVGP
jgi:cysteinyl-tRNA synthetase